MAEALRPLKQNRIFNLDIDAVSAAITQKTKAVLINSPNNPTGQVYSKESLDELGALFKRKREKNLTGPYIL